jgi:hypothetical protein
LKKRYKSRRKGENLANRENKTKKSKIRGKLENEAHSRNFQKRRIYFLEVLFFKNVSTYVLRIPPIPPTVRFRGARHFPLSGISTWFLKRASFPNGDNKIKFKTSKNDQHGTCAAFYNDHFCSRKFHRQEVTDKKMIIIKSCILSSLTTNSIFRFFEHVGKNMFSDISLFGNEKVTKKWLCARSSPKSRYISPKSRELNVSFHFEIRLFRLNFRLILILGEKGSKSGESRLHKRIRLIRLRRQFFRLAG